MYKSIFLKILIISLLFLTDIGCKNEETCYEGKIEILNNNGSGCPNIIRIQKSIDDGLPVNTTISFNANLLDANTKTGDIILFKILKIEEPTTPVLAICLAPRYVAQIEICNQ